MKEINFQVFGKLKTRKVGYKNRMNGIIIFILLGILIFVMYRENKKLVVTSYTVSSEKVPAENDGLKIILLSDLHNNEFGENNQILIEKIEKEKPDLIIVAGDMVVGNPKEDNSVSVDLLERLALKYHILYGNGNHEQRLGIYAQTCDSTYFEYTKQLKNMGIKQLINEKDVLKNMEVYGLEIGKEYYKKTHRPPFYVSYLETLLGKPDKSKFNILIAHNPAYFKEYAEWGADLVLSGHIHGGIVNIPGLGGVISPQYVFFPKYDAGKFIEEESTMILSRGLGSHTIKLRLHNPPEVVSITLKKNLLDKK